MIPSPANDMSVPCSKVKQSSTKQAKLSRSWNITFFTTRCGHCQQVLTSASFGGAPLEESSRSNEASCQKSESQILWVQSIAVDLGDLELLYNSRKWSRPQHVTSIWRTNQLHLCSLIYVHLIRYAVNDCTQAIILRMSSLQAVERTLPQLVYRCNETSN